MRVLIACECSGTVRDAFAALGHDAWSCDLLNTARPAKHYQCDVRNVLDDPERFGNWDMMIAHPPCDYLTNSAAWAYGDGPYHQQVKPRTLVGARRRAAREEAILFFARLMDAPISRIAIENPIGVISSRIRKPDQIIQPHQFGADASKATCLWLKGLPLLVPTEHVAPRIVDGRPRWANQTDSGQNRLSPSDDRAQVRAVTYLGIARAMAEQWAGKA